MQKQMFIQELEHELADLLGKKAWKPNENYLCFIFNLYLNLYSFYFNLINLVGWNSPRIDSFLFKMPKSKAIKERNKTLNYFFWAKTFLAIAIALTGVAVQVVIIVQVCFLLTSFSSTHFFYSTILETSIRIRSSKFKWSSKIQFKQSWMRLYRTASAITNTFRFVSLGIPFRFRYRQCWETR